jgi:hypothetical protein
VEEPQPAPQAEVDTSASRPSEPQPAAGPALASFADAISADVNRSEDREADAAASEAKPAGEPPRSPDVKSGGRRSQAAQANAARIAELERQVAERDPERIRADIEAQRQREAASEAERQLAETDRQEAEEYARLRDLEDRQMTDQEYNWREGYKAKLKLVPEATRTARAHAQQEMLAYQADLAQRYEGAWNHLKSEMAQAASKPGVERDAIVKGGSFREIADHLYEAGRKSLQPDLDRALEKVRKLEAEGRQFRLSGANGLGAARAPINGGRSAAHTNGRPDFRTASSSALFDAAIRATNGDE